ncbi:MAG: MipA/OmpV family protein [Bdellovibrionota bacterium]
MGLSFLSLLLLPALAAAESPFRDPVDFLRKNVMDFKAGPGYIGNENIRIHSSQGSQRYSAKHGFFPLYELRIGPVNISNIFALSGFMKGKKLRLGLLFNYTGDPYESEGIAARKNSLFGGGFLGYDHLTFYSYSDLLHKRAGVIYALHYAPVLFKISGNELFAVFEIEHMNRMYVDYYFGIRPYEITQFLTPYAGRRTTNYAGTLLYVYHISKSAEFMLWGGQKRYGAGVTNSPTVGLKNAYQAGIGWLFKII